jgi:hypothetical protein
VHPLGILLKSYAKDFHYAERMVTSFHQHNRDALPLFLVVPDEDQDIFQPLVRQNTTLLPESDFAEHLVTEPLWDLRPGYINQEIIKLAFWEKGLAENYFCADSELVFIRDFGFDDFMFDERTPYTVLVEDNDLKVEPRYHRDHWQGRAQHLRRIQELIGLNDRRLLTCHGHQVLSRDVLSSLKTDFMEPRGWDYRDLLIASPYEFSWYNFWLQKSRVIPIEQREPLVKTIHHEGQLLELALQGIELEDLARGYVGFVINSNFQVLPEQRMPQLEPADALAQHVHWRTLVSALFRKVRLTRW